VAEARATSAVLFVPSGHVVFDQITPLRFVPSRIAPVRSAFERSAPFRFVPVRFAH
jgi:hypothetical protein